MPKIVAGQHRHGRRTAFEAKLVDEARFIRTWFDNPVLTGAVSPSGPFLARTMAQAIDPAGTGPIVELGPGTGPITHALLKRGIDPGRLLLVEYDRAFCRLLRQRFPQLQIVQGDAYDLQRQLADKLQVPAAAVVSSLPLLNKPDAERLSLLEDAFALMAPGGAFVQFTYGMASPMPRAAAAAFDADVSAPVWLNLPPARVWIYRRKGAGGTDRLAPRSELDGTHVARFRPAKFRPVHAGETPVSRRFLKRLGQRAPARSHER